MLKKHINKILIVLLCFALLPLSLFNFSVAFASDTETVYFGAKYMYYTNDSIKDSSSNQVQIKVKTTNGADEEVIYEDGKQTENQTKVASVAYSSGYITIIFNKEGDFTVSTSVKEKTDDEYKHEKQFTVTKDLSLCSAPSCDRVRTALQAPRFPRCRHMPYLALSENAQKALGIRYLHARPCIAQTVCP